MVNVWAGEAAMSGVATECAGRGFGCPVVGRTFPRVAGDKLSGRQKKIKIKSGNQKKKEFTSTIPPHSN